MQKAWNPGGPPPEEEWEHDVEQFAVYDFRGNQFGALYRISGGQ